MESSRNENLFLRRTIMFRIAAVRKDEHGHVLEIVVDFETTLGRSKEDAAMAFTIKHAEELDGKEAKLVVQGPF